jgi:hypothetical protein
MSVSVSVDTIMKFAVITVCILFLIFVIWKLYRDNIALKGEDSIYWPPEINKCPDYWTYTTDGKCHNGDQTMEPLLGDVTGEILVAKCEEIKKQNIPWEGIDDLC